MVDGDMREIELNLQRHRIVTYAIVGYLVVLSIAVIILAQQTKITQTYKTVSEALQNYAAKRVIPADDRAKGLVYAGLEVDESSCPKGYKVSLSPTAQSKAGRVICTHGPDVIPTGFDVNRSVPPVSNVQGESTKKVLGTAVTCDKSPDKSNKVQLMYVHASDVPDRFLLYENSFKQWGAEMESEFKNSAAQTGGTRNIRFVQDQNCSPTVLNVTVSPKGDDSLGDMLNELYLIPEYSRPDRKYVTFVDARVYCGYGMIQYDDRPGPENTNNLGMTYGRIDAGCWSGVIAAHEFMHTLGGVQVGYPSNVPPPHTDWNTHCTDASDNMCDHSGLPLACLGSPSDPNYPNWANCPCPDVYTQDSRFDCNHDDYFSATAVSPDNYLATHWNTANNIFLIGPYVTSPTATPTPTIGAVNLGPSVTILNPLNGAVLPTSGKVNITASATATPPYTITRMQIFIDGAAVKTCRNNSSCSYGWMMNKLTSGVHSLRVDALDNTNKLGSSTISVTKP